MLVSIKMQQHIAQGDHCREQTAERLRLDRYLVVPTDYGSHMVVDFATRDPVYGVCGGWRLICEARTQELAEKIGAAWNSGAIGRLIG